MSTVCLYRPRVVFRTRRSPYCTSNSAQVSRFRRAVPADEGLEGAKRNWLWLAGVAAALVLFQKTRKDQEVEASTVITGADPLYVKTEFNPALAARFDLHHPVNSHQLQTTHIFH